GQPVAVLGKVQSVGGDDPANHGKKAVVADVEVALEAGQGDDQVDAAVQDVVQQPVLGLPGAELHGADRGVEPARVCAFGPAPEDDYVAVFPLLQRPQRQPPRPLVLGWVAVGEDADLVATAGEQPCRQDHRGLVAAQPGPLQVTG